MSESNKNVVYQAFLVSFTNICVNDTYHSLTPAKVRFCTYNLFIQFLFS